MTIKDAQQPQPQKLAAKPDAGQTAPLQVQGFLHKGELVVAFNQPISQWFLSSEAAREMSKLFADMATQLEAQQSAGATKQ